MSDRTPEAAELRGLVKASWRSFRDACEALRPDLYRYCRYLTRSPWEAEDLAQETLARAFATLATLLEDVREPRAWLFRIASNLWIDRTRRAREVLVEPPERTDPTSDARAAREAAGTLFAQLSPQERAAVVLKDVFDMTLEEIAEMLTTTEGAVKTALHRGRGKLAEPIDPPPHTPDRAVLDAFCSAFNARDLERLTALLLDTAEVELVGTYTEYGRKEHGLLRHTVIKPLSSGVDAKYLSGYLDTPPRAEVRAYRGEPIILYWYAHDDGEHVRSVVRLETDDGRIARLREYFVTPDLLAEVCGELRVSFRTNGIA